MVKPQPSKLQSWVRFLSYALNLSTVRLVVQDIALSRREHGFESRTVYLRVVAVAARQAHNLKVVGSNPTPEIYGFSLMVKRRSPKPLMWVRFPQSVLRAYFDIKLNKKILKGECKMVACVFKSNKLHKQVPVKSLFTISPVTIFAPSNKNNSILNEV